MAQRLAELIGARIDAGVLPEIVHTKRWVGYGENSRCDACGERILPAQLEHELDFTERPSIRLHDLCARLYDAALRCRGSTPAD